MPYLNKRILFCGLNVDCLLIDLAFYKFGSDFSEKLIRFLIEALRLNDNHLYDTPVNLQSCNLANIPNFLTGVSFCVSNFWYGLKGGGHNVFKAANLPTNWLKIPKSVNVTDFPFEQLFKYLVYLAELCCDSQDEVLVDGRSLLRSCRLAVGVVGVIGTFSLP